MSGVAPIIHKFAQFREPESSPHDYLVEQNLGSPVSQRVIRFTVEDLGPSFGSDPKFDESPRPKATYNITPWPLLCPQEMRKEIVDIALRSFHDLLQSKGVFPDTFQFPYPSAEGRPCPFVATMEKV